MDVVGFAEVAVVVVLAKVLGEFVEVEVVHLAEVAGGMTLVRSVVYVSGQHVSRQTVGRVVLAFRREYLRTRGEGGYHFNSTCSVAFHFYSFYVTFIIEHKYRISVPFHSEIKFKKSSKRSSNCKIIINL